MSQDEWMWNQVYWDDDDNPPPEPDIALEAGAPAWSLVFPRSGGRNGPQDPGAPRPAPLDLGAPRRAEEPFAAAADATEASASALAARDTEATSAELPVVKAEPNAQKPKPAHGIVKSRPTKEQRERMERNRLAALDRLAVTRASSP